MAADDQEAKQGISVAEQLRARPGNSFYLRANLYYAILLLIIAGLVVLVLFVVSRPDKVSAKSVMEAQEQQLQLSRQMAESLKAISGKNDEAEAKLNDIRIDVPGVSARNQDNGITLVFEAGLFDGGGVKLKPEAMSLLSLLGRQLEPHIGHVSVCVVGHTDNLAMPGGGQYRDNAALAMARAVAVVEHLRASARLPADMFSMRGLGESMSPHPNDAPDGRARNRTVVIQLSRSR